MNKKNFYYLLRNNIKHVDDALQLYRTYINEKTINDDVVTIFNHYKMSKNELAYHICMVLNGFTKPPTFANLSVITMPNDEISNEFIFSLSGEERPSF